MYTQLSATLNTTVARGVPAILSAPYYLDQTQSYRMGTGTMRESSSSSGSSRLEEEEEEETAASAIESDTRYSNSTAAVAAAAAAAARDRAADPGFPNRDCGTKIGHIDGIWECFYSAGPTDGIVDEAAALNTSLVLGGEACIWVRSHAPCFLPAFPRICQDRTI
jgi:hypothetical protein